MASERRGQTLLAWAVILALVGFLLVRPARKPSGDGMEGVELKIQGRTLVGIKALMPDAVPPVDQARQPFAKSTLDRIAFAVLVAELADEQEPGLAELAGVKVETEEEVRAAGLVEKLVKGEEVPEEEADWLVGELGWFGKLAVSWQDEALHAALVRESMRTVVVGFGALVLGLLGILLGLGVVAGALFAAYQGWVAAPSLDGDHGGVYAETFALYLSLYIGLSFLASFGAWGDWGFGLGGVLMVFSLVALFWPRLRGVKWSRVREDVGLTFSWLDLPGGVATYLGVLPLVVVGVVILVMINLTLKRWGVTPPTPSHPVAEAARGVPWWVWAQIVVVACVCAPIVEEIFFRGVLYAHLSRLGKAWPRAWRVALAVGLSSFVFAVIHPQGWLGVPVLSALAAAFALAREWRGGLVPGMVAHALNNGVAVLVLYLTVA